MTCRWIAVAVFVLLLVAAAAQLLYYYPLMPHRMAAHFDWQGRPDGWESKNALFTILAATTFGSAGLLLLIALATKWVPASMINIPNKDIRLVPPEDRRTRALLVNVFVWVASATVVLAMTINQAVIRASLAPPASGSTVLIAIGLYVVFTLGLWAWFVRRFRRRPS